MSTTARIKEFLKWPVEKTFERLESKLISSCTNASLRPPIVVLGPPRSGTTLLMQLIVHRFQSCYFSNFVGRFSDSPVVLAYIARLLGGCSAHTDFTSHYGRTRGWDDPYDGTKIWLRWFPYAPVYSPLNSLSDTAIDEIRSTVAAYSKVFDAPFVNKAQRNNGRIMELNRAFPEAVFIRITRDHERLVQSILHALDKEMKNHDIWFSLRPSNHEQITTTDVLEHVCEEVFYTEQDIDRDSAAIGEDRVFSVEYEQICEQPQVVLDDFARFYSARTNTELQIRAQVPERFPLSSRQYGDLESATRIREHLNYLLDKEAKQ